MALWAALTTIAAALIAAVTIEPFGSALVAGSLELAAVLALFTLVCAAEAAN